MNLDNLNLVELDAQEVQEVDGGLIIEYNLLCLAVVFGIGFYNGYHNA